MMLNLHNLAPLVKKRKRVGRGGKLGGTSGKGHKGQKARSGGKVRLGFEGGQMPLYRRLPKRGFNNFEFQDDKQIVNIKRLDLLFDGSQVITKELLIQKNVIKGYKSKKNFILKVLGNGPLTKKLIICADAFSATALKSIEDQGGEARIIKEI